MDINVLLLTSSKEVNFLVNSVSQFFFLIGIYTKTLPFFFLVLLFFYI